MVVNVEQGVVNPSVGTLLKISDALGAGLAELVEPPALRRTKVTRQGSGAVLWTGELGGRGILVASTEPPDVVELWDWMLAPGERHVSEAHTAGTRELLQVIAGVLVVDIQGEAHRLSVGDALAFRSDVAHHYAAEESSSARFSLAVFEPGVGQARRSEPSHV